MRYECGGATPAPRVNDYKHEMRTLTIIGEAGYRVGSINSFSNALDLINAKITDPADRMTEHDRTELILNAVMSANQGAVSDDALKEYNRPAAARLYLQPNAGVAAAAGAPPNPPAGARSQQQVVSALSKLWDSQVRAGMMMIHGVSRTRVVGGSNSSFLVQCDACERVATSRSASVSLAMSRMDLGLVRAHHYHRARQRIPRRLSLHPWCLSLLPS